ncbi:MAG: regulatory protein RecX [Anaerolineaceae bacterium]
MDHKITDLKQQKRNPNRINIYLDGEYSFGLSRIVAVWLQIGQMISDDKIAKLKNEDQIEVALQKALGFINYRPRTESEVSKKLSGLGYDDNEIEIVINRLREIGVLSDDRFAQMWIENRTTFRPRSQKMLKMELRNKKVAEEIIQQALAEAENDEVLALDAGNRYAKRLVHLDGNDFRKKLSAFLARRGFSYGIVIPVVNKIWADVQAAKELNMIMENED